VAEDDPGLFWNVRHEIGDTPPPRKHPNIKTMVNRPVISNTHIKTWVPRGYIVVHSCSPGTGLSEGVPTVGGENESLAPKAVIDWLCGRGNAFTEADNEEEVEAYWSTGKIGMTGTSYNGTLPIAAATTGVEGLEAIIPIAPNTSYYHYYRSNGLVRSPGGYLGEDIDVLFDFIYSGDPSKRAYGNRVVRDELMRPNIDRETGDLNAFWESRDYLNQMDDFKAALLMSHGFNDWNVMPEHSYRIYEAAREKGVPVQIYYHQDGHGGPPPMELCNKWFTRYLFGVENGVENDPKSWIVRENDPQDKPTSYPDYPHPDASPVVLALKAGAPGTGGLIYGEKGDEKVETLIDNFSFDGAMLAQAEITEHRLLYLTETLKQDVHISGIPEITVNLASSKPAVNLSVWLVSMPWNSSRRARNTDNIINRGWADPQNRNSLSESEPLEPGEFYTITFELQPDDQILRAGSQIGLLIFSSDKEFTLHPEPGTELSIDLSGTHLTLPIVGGERALRGAIE
jgi:X-Pro dipeptidyl-peptidase